MNTEEKESRKKLLVPLVVLLLCAVAFTGAAYAYSSTVTVDDNNLTAKTLSVDLKNGEPAEDIVTAEGLVTFTDQYKYPASGYKTNAVKCDVDTKLAFTVKLKITGDASASKLYVYSDNLTTFLAKEIGNKKISDLFTVYVTDSSDVNAQNIATAGKALVVAKNATCSFDIDKGKTDIPEKILYVWVKAASNDSIVVQSATATKKIVENVEVDNDECKYAVDFANTIKGAGLNLTFEAEE